MYKKRRLCFALCKCRICGIILLSNHGYVDKPERGKTMKKKIISVLAVLLCLSLIVPIGVTAFAKTESQSYSQDNMTLDEYLADCEANGRSVEVVNSSNGVGDVLGSLSSTSTKTILMNIVAKTINALSNVLITVLGKALGNFIPKTSVLNNFADFSLEDYENFFAGMDEFLDAPAEGAKWNLGYAVESILPADFGERAYTMGGYGLMAETKETFDGLWVRTIVLNDGTGRGNVVFAVLDAIGIANADVRAIRESVADFAEENNIVSINVSVTHTHSGIDLQGVWTNTVGNVLNNIFLSNLGLTQIQSGVDRTFLNTIITQTSKSIKEAYADMTGGTLTLAKKDISDYLRDRTAPYSFDKNIYRLEFTPDDAAQTPTIIASFSAHPENSGYEFTVISADFVPYIQEVLNKAGYNFIYIQGCIGTITYQRGNSDDGLDLDRHEEAVRYGYEIGYILLGMTKTQAECAKLNDELGDFLGVKQYSGQKDYSIWYENWQPVAEETVAPMLNIANKQYIIEVSNALLDIVGKTGITDYFFLYDYATGKYYTVTECGYMELGNSLKVELCPGETYGELLVGGKGLDGFQYDSLRDTYGENMIVFDLMNDAIGYIEPDDDYVMAGMQYSESKDKFDTDTWCLISWGQHTASKVISEFMGLVDSVR